MKFPIIFAGTADIGAPLLRSLAKDERFEVKQVISSPDRPAGRKLELTPCPLKQVALELNLPVFQPEDINSPDSLEFIKALNPVALLVMAYGQLFKNELLELAPKGCLNIHTSLLPQYRGASPIQSALLNQDQLTGISLMQMAKGMDSGPVFCKTQVEIDPSDNSITLTEKLAQKTGEVIPGQLYQILTDELKPLEQNESGATYCKKITKEDGLIHWEEGSKTIDAKIRAFCGWPGTYTFFEGKRLKILSAAPQAISCGSEAGTVFEREGKVLVQTGNGSLELLELQLEGKKRQGIDEFLRGNSGFLGGILGI